jgi:hypothetical protein
VTVVREVLAEVSGHLDFLFAVQAIGSYPIAVGGSDGVRKLVAPTIAGCSTPRNVRQAFNRSPRHYAEVLPGAPSFVTKSHTRY